jgi:hypothetical protein
MAKALPRAVLDGFKKHRIDVLVHCGDIVSPAVIPIFEAVAPLAAVAGNNDGPQLVERFGRKKILQFGPARIGVVHGDGAKSGWKTPDHAMQQFAKDDVKAVLFGHSHIPYCKLRDGVLLFNPGSPTDKRLNPRYSYGIVTIDGAAVEGALHYFWDKSP